MRKNEGAAGWSAQHKMTIYMPDVTRDERFIEFDNMQVTVNSLVCFPLLNNGTTEAVICLSHSKKNAFADNIVYILEILKFNIGSAIGNIRLADQIRSTNTHLNETNENLHKTLLELYTTQLNLANAESFSGLKMLTSGIAHEFNNIFAGIVGYSELAKIQQDPDSIKRYINSILTLSSRATDVIQKLHAFSSRSTGAHVFLNISKEINAIIDLIKPVIESAGLKLHKKLRPVSDTKGDIHQISQVLLHLISNAIDAMEPGGRLAITTEEKSGWIECIIEDTGSGIQPSIIENIYTPFITTKGVLGGGNKPRVGLGLPIVQNIIKKHYGEINIFTTVNKGTKVVIRLPSSAHDTRRDSAELQK